MQLVEQKQLVKQPRLYAGDEILTGKVMSYSREHA
jgi:hypothetical protein